MIIFKPQEYDGILVNNPFKGWVAWGENLKNYSDTISYNMIYARVLWAQIEPESGCFKWDEFEETWNFSAATGNKKIIMRVVLDNPNEHHSGMTMDIPEWLYAMMYKKGTHYNKPEIGEGFSPDYSDQKLIAQHKIFLTELGKRYNNDSRVAFIQIGSLGHWGEWHTWPMGTGIFPNYAVAVQYVQHYIDAFPDKALVARRPLKIHGQNKLLGLYNDIIGDNNEWGTPAWLRWIKEGYVSEWESEFHPPLETDWWKKACSGGELSWHKDGIIHWFKDSQFVITIQHIIDSHTSWIGPSSPVNIHEPGEYQQKIDELYKLLGYRFVIEEVVYENIAHRQSDYSIKCTVNNKGVAPFYFQWPLEVAIADKNGNIMLKEICHDTDIRDWMPGWNEFNITLNFPDFLPHGKYEILLAVINPDTGLPGLEFAIHPSMKTHDGRYNIVSFTLID